jgi:hypothetical protein
MDPDNPPSLQVILTFFYLQGRIPRGVDQLVITFHEIDNLMPLKEHADKIRMFWDLLKGQVLCYSEHHLRRRLEAEDSEIPDNELIELVLRDIGLEYIPKCAIHIQKYYMRQTRGLYMGINTSLQQFAKRLNDLNRYLLFSFLKKTPSS